MSLSVVITALNEDPQEINATIASIRQTAGDVPEIVLVDDCSSAPVVLEDKSVHVIHNRHRCGVGPSRHIGVLAAQGRHVLLTDAHMRFLDGWCYLAMRRIASRPMTLHCAGCIGIDANNLNPRMSRNYYYGGTINVCGPDKNAKGKTQVFEAVWRDKEPADDEEICCCTGACYFIPRDWFLHIDPLRLLRTWGEDEIMLSVKTWLSGGDVRYMKTVQIGHRFRLPGERIWWDTPLGHRTWNKLLALHSLLPPESAAKLENKIPHSAEKTNGLADTKRDWHLVATEIARNQTIFKRDFEWLARKFNLHENFG